jgi:hypothetical protein
MKVEKVDGGDRERLICTGINKIATPIYKYLVVSRPIRF